MDTKKMRWVSGNSVIEMSYIMPLFFSLFVIIIHTVFYYHDKAIIEALRLSLLLWERSMSEDMIKIMI